MKQAIDLDTGRLVDADEASNWVRGTFKCPCCFDTVVLAWGAIVTPHFRHQHATYRTDCENYQFGDSGGSGGGSGEGRWLALYVVPSIRLRNVSWRLELFVPDPGPTLGLAHYKDARGEQTLHSRRSARGGSRIKVLPQERAYQVVFGPRDSGAARRLEIPGLQRQFANAFNYSDIAGRRLGSNEPLVVGESYVVVCHSTSRLPDWDQVESLQIGREGDWFGSIVTLPPDYSDALQSWCRRRFNRSLTTPKAKLTLLYPPSAAMLDDGVWAIPLDRSDIYVACDGPAGAETPSQLGWKYRYTDRPRWSFLRGSLPAFLGETAQYRAWFEVLLRDDPRTGLELLIGEQPALIAPAGAQVTTRSEANAAPRTASLFSKAASERLQAVREGREELVSISLPAGLVPKVSVKGPTDRLWTTLEDEAIDVDDSAMDLADRLPNVLFRRELTVRIDAGNFGFVELVGAPAPEVLARQVDIPGRLRDRIVWLLATATHCVAAAGKAHQPLGFPGVCDALLDRVSLRDRSLLMKFVRVRVWPAELAAHARVAARELLRLTREGG